MHIRNMFIASLLNFESYACFPGVYSKLIFVVLDDQQLKGNKKLLSDDARGEHYELLNFYFTSIL